MSKRRRGRVHVIKAFEEPGVLGFVGLHLNLELEPVLQGLELLLVLVPRILQRFVMEFLEEEVVGLHLGDPCVLGLQLLGVILRHLLHLGHHVSRTRARSQPFLLEQLLAHLGLQLGFIGWRQLRELLPLGVLLLAALATIANGGGVLGPLGRDVPAPKQVTPPELVQVREEGLDLTDLRRDALALFEGDLSLLLRGRLGQAARGLNLEPQRHPGLGLLSLADLVLHRLLHLRDCGCLHRRRGAVWVPFREGRETGAYKILNATDSARSYVERLEKTTLYKGKSQDGLDLEGVPVVAEVEEVIPGDVYALNNEEEEVVHANRYSDSASASDSSESETESEAESVEEAAQANPDADSTSEAEASQREAVPLDEVHLNPDREPLTLLNRKLPISGRMRTCRYGNMAKHMGKGPPRRWARCWFPLLRRFPLPLRTQVRTTKGLTQSQMTFLFGMRPSFGRCGGAKSPTTGQ